MYLHSPVFLKLKALWVDFQKPQSNINLMVIPGGHSPPHLQRAGTYMLCHLLTLELVYYVLLSGKF